MRAALELLLAGWKHTVTEADVSDRHRQVVAETAAWVRDALKHHTTPHNLICTVLAPAFLLPYEPDMAVLTTAELEALGATFRWGEDACTRRCSTTPSRSTRPHHKVDNRTCGSQTVASCWTWSFSG